MTSYFIQTFFPDLAQLLQQRTPALWNTVFDPALQAACRTHSMPVQLLPSAGPVAIRWPWLLPCAALGILVGLACRTSLQRHSNHALWAHACLFFSGMNTAAIACHCLSPPGSVQYALLAATDVAFTGASSVCMALAAGTRLAKSWSPTRLAALSHGVLLLALLCAHAGSYFRVPFTAEVLYLGMIGAAVPVVGTHLAKRAPSRIAALWRAFAVGAAAVAAAAVALDSRLCAFFGASFNATHVVFLCCSAAFIGVTCSLLQQHGPEHSKRA